MPKLSELSDADLERLAAQTVGELPPEPAPQLQNGTGTKRPQETPIGASAKTLRPTPTPVGGSSASSSSVSRFELLGDSPWFARPLKWRSHPGQHWAPNMVFQRIASAAERLPRALENQADALFMATAALNSDAPPAMRGHEAEALFAEASRLLFAVLGFSCEGFCPPQVKARTAMRGLQLPTWYGVAPQPLLAQWFNMSALPSMLSGAALRASFDAAPRKQQAQFLCGLSRAAALEVGRAEFNNGKQLRPSWAKILDRFPEVAKIRAIYAHVRQRCWEDVRDRSRSRSPGEERRKKQQEQKQNALPPGCIRFFVKKLGNLDEYQLERHFAGFGTVQEVNVLKDKKTQKSRGLAFVVLKAEGWNEGKKVMVKDLREWVLADKHTVGGVKLEVTEAEDKPVEDEGLKVEERVAERRRIRVDKEKRMGKDTSAEEKLVPSLWYKRWRNDIWARLPKEYEPPATWTNPKVVDLCYTLWKEITDHICKTQSSEALAGLSYFVADEAAQAAGKDWCYVPGADFLLLLGEGFLGVTVEGVFACSQGQDPPPLPPNFDIETLTTMPLPGGVPSAIVGGSAIVQGGPSSPAASPRGTDKEKVFVGGLTPSTTLEMLTSYFATYGPILDAVVMMDKVTGKPRGFGFVVFESVNMVDAVLQDYSRHRIDGKWVEVKRACPQEVMAAAAGTQGNGQHTQQGPPGGRDDDGGSQGPPRFVAGGSESLTVTMPPPAAPRTFAEYDPLSG